MPMTDDEARELGAALASRRLSEGSSVRAYDRRGPHGGLVHVKGTTRTLRKGPNGRLEIDGAEPGWLDAERHLGNLFYADKNLSRIELPDGHAVQKVEARSHWGEKIHKYAALDPKGKPISARFGDQDHHVSSDAVRSVMWHSADSKHPDSLGGPGKASLDNVDWFGDDGHKVFKAFDKAERLKPTTIYNNSRREWDAHEKAQDDAYKLADKLRKTGHKRLKEAAVLTEAKDSMKKASTPEPFSSSKTSNWVARAGGLPAYIQHIAHDLVEKRGKSESNAIQMAIGIVKRWAKGVGNVDANTRAAAAKAVAEWEKLKAKNAAKKVAEAELAVAGGTLTLSEVFALEEAEHKLKCPKCEHVMDAGAKKCPNCDHDMADARKAKFAKMDEAEAFVYGSVVARRALEEAAVKRRGSPDPH